MSLVMSVHACLSFLLCCVVFCLVVLVGVMCTPFSFHFMIKVETINRRFPST